MFAICAVCLVVVSYLTPAPDRRVLAGLTFGTVDEKLETTQVELSPKKFELANETRLERRLNIAFSALLVATVVGLWIFFR